MSIIGICRECDEWSFWKMGGNGKCAACHGTGASTQLSRPDPNCAACWGTGVCARCGGKGVALIDCPFVGRLPGDQKILDWHLLPLDRLRMPPVPLGPRRISAKFHEEAIDSTPPKNLSTACRITLRPWRPS
jgi:hypothetical protein